MRGDAVCVGGGEVKERRGGKARDEKESYVHFKKGRRGTGMEGDKRKKVEGRERMER